MNNFISTLLFDQSSWLMIIPVVIIILGIVLWNNPLCLEPWAQRAKSGSINSYYLPVATLLKTHIDQQQKISKKSQFISQYIKYSIFLSLILIALAQPYQTGQKIPEPPQYRDIVFLVDTSITMSLKDYQLADKRIERMSMLKSVLSHFIDKLQGNRIGITAFSNRTYTLVPLTTDYALLKTQLHRLEPAVLTGRTSDPSSALLYAAKQYHKNDEKPAFVILTDIDRPDRRIDPRTAARYLSQQGFHLHTIGIGAGSHAAKDDEISSLIYQPANFQLLEDIATAGNGKFFWAKNITSLNSALQHIQSTELRKIDAEPEYIKQPLYMWFVLAALAWLSLWQLLPIFRVYR